uniref:Cell division ftsY-like protein n=1 Tax=Aegilops tauschii TaxID=37682 RepID=M8B1V3_AEGTA
MASAPSRALPFLSPPSTAPASASLRAPSSRLRCAAAAGQAGFFTRLGRLIKEKAKSDVDKLFSGFSKTRENLSVVDELLTYWNLADTDRVLDDLEEALLVSDFGPKISFRIVDTLRDQIRDGKLKSGTEIKASLKRCILELLTTKGSKTELQLGFRFCLPSAGLNEAMATSLPLLSGVSILSVLGRFGRKPAVIMIVGVNGGGKTTSLGKLAYRFKNEGAKVLMAAGDTFRAAARDQLEIWAERTGSEIVIDNDKKAQAPSGLHTNYGLMEELVSCKKVIAKALPGAPNEILLVLDGTTGLNMLQQAKEFNDVVGITGFILTKLDGTARGGCVVSVVDELGIPVKFVGVGEGVEDLQPFDAEAFVEAIFP